MKGFYSEEEEREPTFSLKDFKQWLSSNKEDEPPIKETLEENRKEELKNEFKRKVKDKLRRKKS